MRATVRRPDGEAVHLRIEGITTRAKDLARGQPVGSAPTPEELLAASLASCTATTMEIYAERKGWKVDEVDYTPAQRGSPTRCSIVIRLPADLPPEQRERLMQIGATSRTHRALEGEILFEERLEPMTEAEAAVPEPGDEPARGPRPPRIRIANSLRGALRNPRGAIGTVKGSSRPRRSPTA